MEPTRRGRRKWTLQRTQRAILVASLAFLFVASVFAVAPARGDVESFTLYGGQASGWGFTTTLTNPGPTITVTLGDTVDLTLNSVDANSVTHNWFIDYNNNLQADTGEPKSNDFSGTPAVTFSFTADRVGTFTYRCGYHPTTMTGQIIIQTVPTFELYGGDFGTFHGWGAENTTTSITSPGPTLVVNQSQAVTIDLVSADGQLHSWFIDLNNDRIQQTTEPHSADFGASTRYSFTVGLAPGNYTYRCQYHPTVMFGNFTVRATGGGGGLNSLVLVGGVIIVVAIVAVAAAVMMRRKKPQPPP